jgi:hypothetical protein
VSQRRNKFHARRRDLWEVAKRELLEDVRARLHLEPDEFIPDAVLLAEVDGYLPPGPPKNGSLNYGLGRRKRWFAYRLVGIGSTDEDRRVLAASLKAGPAGGLHWGLLGFAGPARRSPQAGRRRRRDQALTYG